MNGIKLISTGSAVPKKVVTNDDLAKIVDTNDEWISTRTGIRSRRYCTDGESHTSLCLAAARQALERGGVAPGEIGICLVATVTPDFLSPAAACLLQKELGFPEDTICFDLNAACSGFVYALHTAECLLASTPRKYGLVLGAEILSRVMDFGDRSTCVLFGDGAGAALVEWGANYPSLHAVLGCRGNSEVLYVPGVNTAARLPMSIWTASRCSASPWRLCPAVPGRCWTGLALPRRTSTSSCSTRPTSASSTLP